MHRRKELVPQLLGQYSFLPRDDSYHHIGGYPPWKDLKAEGLAQHSLKTVTKVGLAHLPADHDPQARMPPLIGNSIGR